MADLKRKGDLAELKVATDLLRQGHRIALPHEEDWEADLFVERAGMNTITLRLTTARNNQRIGIRMAADYETLALPSAAPWGRGDNGNTRPLHG